MSYKHDPAAAWLEEHGEEFHRGNELKVAKSATDLAESAPQIKPVPGAQVPKSGINLRKVAEVLEEYGLDPTVEIVKVLNEGSLDDALRAKVLLELLQYTAAKRKAIEISGKDGGDIKHSGVFNVNFVGK